MQQQGEGRAEIYTYESPHLVYAAGWSVSAARALAKPGVVRCACACLPLRSTCLRRLQLCSMLWLLLPAAGRRCPCTPPCLEALHASCLPMWLQVRPDKPFRLALGSFIEDYANRVEIVQRELLVQPRQQFKGASAAVASAAAAAAAQRSSAKEQACGSAVWVPPVAPCREWQQPRAGDV